MIGVGWGQGEDGGCESRCRLGKDEPQLTVSFL